MVPPCWLARWNGEAMRRRRSPQLAIIDLDLGKTGLPPGRRPLLHLPVGARMLAAGVVIQHDNFQLLAQDADGSLDFHSGPVSA